MDVVGMKKVAMEVQVTKLEVEGAFELKVEEIDQVVVVEHQNRNKRIDQC